MLINADFNSIVVVTPDDRAWVDSPQAGVRRVMLDRVGEERARATSLVRYAPGASFPTHTHPGGEEILVLEGTFTDDLGDCPRGSYLRNPPGSRHAPSSREGCLILVKLWQMAPTETATLRLDTRSHPMWESRHDRRSCQLFDTADEHVCIDKVQAGWSLFAGSESAAELLVLDGDVQFIDRGQRRTAPAGTWLRASGPDAADFLASMVAGPYGCTVYVKRGRVVATPAVPSKAALS